MRQPKYVRRYVVDRCIIDMRKLSARDGATRADVKTELKREGFTDGEIEDAGRRLSLEEDK